MAAEVEVYNDHKLCKPHVPYVLSNWCYIDSLDGEELVDGEELMIVWADGHASKEKLYVDKHSEPYNDMGHTYDMSVVKAYVQVPIHGALAKVRLVEARVQSATRVKGE